MLKNFAIQAAAGTAANQGAGPFYLADEAANQVKIVDNSGALLDTLTADNDIRDVDVDSDGNVYIASGNTVKKYDSLGVLVYNFTGHASNVNSVSCDASGNAYSGSSDGTARKIDPTGSQLWSYNAVQAVDQVQIDTNNILHITDIDQIIRLDSSGNKIVAAGQVTGANGGRGIAVTPTSETFATWGGSQPYVINKYEGGTLTEGGGPIDSYTFPAGVGLFANDLKNNANAVYAANNSSKLYKLDNNLVLQWESLNMPNGTASDLTIGQDGFLYVASGSVITKVNESTGAIEGTIDPGFSFTRIACGPGRYPIF